VVEPIVIPDATREPAAYVAALLDTLGDRDSLEVYAASPKTVHKLCAGLDEAAWLAPMAPGEWNAHQVVGHLLDVDVVYGFRWRLALTEDNPSFPATTRSDGRCLPVRRRRGCWTPSPGCGRPTWRCCATSAPPICAAVRSITSKAVRTSSA
jgi:hypothetical protein